MKNDGPADASDYPLWGRDRPSRRADLLDQRRMETPPALPERSGALGSMSGASVVEPLRRGARSGLGPLGVGIDPNPQVGSTGPTGSCGRRSGAPRSRPAAAAPSGPLYGPPQVIGTAVAGDRPSRGADLLQPLELPAGRTDQATPRSPAAAPVDTLYDRGRGVSFPGGFGDRPQPRGSA